jgi:outer membrane receptor protein involved in Fe transport
MVSDTVKLESRLHWNLYEYRGHFARPPAAGGVELDTYSGQWVGAEQRVVFTPQAGLKMTLGGEAQYHYRANQLARDDSGVFLEDTGNRARTYRVGAVYGLFDVVPFDQARLSLGLRLDSYSTFGESLNPRAAFIVKPYAEGNLKVMFGKAFRAPSTYELYYNDGGITQVASPGLGPESIYSFEVEHQHRFSSVLTGIASVYANEITNLIVTRGAGTAAEPLHYQNASTPLVTLGAELAVRRDWRQGFMVQAGAGVQGTRFVMSESLSDVLGLVPDPLTRDVQNSPMLLASLKAAAPLVTPALTLASRLTLEGARYDRYELTTDLPQGKTSAAVIWDVVLTGRAERLGLAYSLGAYNLADWKYSLPVSAEFTQRTMLQNGRTFLASIELSL